MCNLPLYPHHLNRATLFEKNFFFLAANASSSMARARIVCPLSKLGFDLAWAFVYAVILIVSLYR